MAQTWLAQAPEMLDLNALRLGLALFLFNLFLPLVFLLELVAQ
jgi:hypothetical protein